MAAQPSSSAVRALALEYKTIQDEPVEGFRIKLTNDDILFDWEVAIFGPPETLYQGGYFKVFTLSSKHSRSAFSFQCFLFFSFRLSSSSHMIIPTRPPLWDLLPKSGTQMCMRWVLFFRWNVFLSSNHSHVFLEWRFVHFNPSPTSGWPSKRRAALWEVESYPERQVNLQNFFCVAQGLAACRWIFGIISIKSLGDFE